MKNQNQRAFTLIELLVVISIIAVLSAIILAAVTNGRMRAQNAHILQDVMQMRSTLELTRAANGQYPGFTANSTTCFHGATFPAAVSTFTTDITNINKGVVMNAANTPPGNPPWNNIGVIVFTNANSNIVCSLPTVPTDYAIYAAYVGTGGTLAGYFCADSNGKTTTTTVTPAAGYGSQDTAAGSCI